MYIETLKLKNFRNYGTLTLHPHPGVNLFFGQNGSGKTNLLEAIHYCALGRSHRTGQDREVVMQGQQSAAAGVTVKKEHINHDVAVQLTPGGARKKQAFIDRKRAPRLSEMMGKLQCVIFSPQDLQIIKGGPDLRRRFMDMLLSQLDAKYFSALQQYQKALEQRNAVLREYKRTRHADEAMLDAFEQAMASSGAEIAASRGRMMQQLNCIAAAKYAAISGREKQLFDMDYQCCIKDFSDGSSLQAQFITFLQANRYDDMVRGYTTFGVHRQDIDITMNGRPMKQFASQGQVRTAALSMKLAQLSLFYQVTGEQPILLLDDVMSELDMTRRNRLINEIAGVQTFVTCTDETDLENTQNKRAYHVCLTTDTTASIEELTPGEATPRIDEEPDFS